MEDLKIEDEDSGPCCVGSVNDMLRLREAGLLGRPSLLPKRPKPEHGDVISVPDPEREDSTNPPATEERQIPFYSFSEESVASEAAEERFLERLAKLRDPELEESLEKIECQLGGRQTRCSFLVVFSPDKGLMASTHGDHNIYITTIADGKCRHTLKGHPHTPWCVAFHPTQEGLLASGCLGGHVRVWDLVGNGSELWRSENVIASLAFHPMTRLLVVATYDELHFWDWTCPKPFTKCSTSSEKEKVRYVKFDALGHQLITGIANLSARDAAGSNSSGNLTHFNSYFNEPRRNPPRRMVEPNVNDMSLRPRLNPQGIGPDLTYGRYRSVRRPPASRDPQRESSGASESRSLFYDRMRRIQDPETRQYDRTQSSASQTLSDLAAAASNRLMAENAAAAGIDANEAAAAVATLNSNPRESPQFSHSPGSSFVEVNVPETNDRPSTNRTEVFSNRSSTSRSSAQERYRQISERRLRRHLTRQQTMTNQLDDYDSLSAILPQESERGPARSWLSDWAMMRRTERPVERHVGTVGEADEWNDTSSNSRSDIILRPNPNYEESRALEPTVTATPESSSLSSTAPAPSPSTGATRESNPPPSHNDHTYSTDANRPSRQNHDIVQMSRHILHMQRICRDSLADCAVNRRRRQIVRLQYIRRMLEDLQRQIRSLRNVEGRSVVDDSTTRASRRSRHEDVSDDIASTVRGSSRSRLGERASMRMLGIRMRHPVRSRPPRVPTRRSTVSPEAIRRVHQPIQRSTRPRLRISPPPRGQLSRAHNQLVAQLRASFRRPASHEDKDKEEEEDEKAKKLASPSLNVVVKDGILARRKGGKCKNTPRKTTESASNGSVGELRAMSQRLERLLRDSRVREETSNETFEDNEDTTESLSTGEQYLSMFQRRGRESRFTSDPMSRYRHLMEGLDREERSPLQHSPSYFVSNSDSDSDETWLAQNRQQSSPNRYSSSRHMDLFSPSRHLGLTSRNRRLPPRFLHATMRRHLPEVPSASSDLTSNGQEYENGDESPTNSPRSVLRMISDRIISATEDGASADPDVRNPDIEYYLPPLRELIWRRLRRRNAQLADVQGELSRRPPPVDAEQPNPPADQPGPSNELPARRRHREALSRMVDQMSLDQDRQSSLLRPVGTVRSSSQLVWDRWSVREVNDSDGQPLPPPPSHLPYPPRHFNFLRNREPRYYARANVGSSFHRDHYMHYSPPSSMLLTHRIQSWDFEDFEIPDIKNSETNLVVKEARIHNDASVDISEDGSILVTLVPSNLPMTTVVGVFQVKPSTDRGRCLATCSPESSAVSVSLSPTSRHLIVGLNMRAARMSINPIDSTMMAQIFKLQLPQNKGMERGRLIHRRDVHHPEAAQTKLNCVRWIPTAGQGIVYATSTGLLKILR